MDHLQAATIILEWRRRNRIRTWNEARLLLKTYAMIIRKYNGDVNADVKFLAYPSDTKGLKKFLHTTMHERARTLNWYKLNEEGRKIVRELIADLKLQPSQLESYIFTL